MVCDGPDPPDSSPHDDVTSPPRYLLMNVNHAEDSDDDHEYIGYEPLPQGPDAVHSDHDNSDEDEQNDLQNPTNNVPPIEPMETVLSRDAWNTPRTTDPIQMDNERAQQVMMAMANFALPETSIPEWAQSITEDQWKQTLNERIEKLKSNR